MSAGELLSVVLRERPAPIPTEELAVFWAASAEARERFALPFDRAVVGGFLSNRLGFAFASGYQAALLALVPALRPDGVASFCVTEEGGNHPRAIHTTLERREDGGDVVVAGVKRWCLASAKTFIVVGRDMTGSTGSTEASRPTLRAVRVELGTPGVTLSSLPPTPFVPEVLHAELRLDGVRLASDAVLPGDGYDDYTKPFRTVEDLHVQAALLGYLSSVGVRSRWPEELRERLAALIVTGRGLAALGATLPETHLALAGFLSETTALVLDLDPAWAEAGAAERDRWQRDRMLVQVASKARATRRERAWEAVVGGKKKP